MPASRAAWMIRIDSSWSGLPQDPNIIAPRHILLTETPVRPSRRWSIRFFSRLVGSGTRSGVVGVAITNDRAIEVLATAGRDGAGPNASDAYRATGSCTDQPLPSGSEKKQKRPHGNSWTSETATPAAD